MRRCDDDANKPPRRMLLIETAGYTAVIISLRHYVRSIHFCRAMLQARPIPSCGICLSVRLSVSRSWILSKRINISSKNFTVGQPHYYHFSVPNVMASFRREPLPQRGSRMRVGYAEIAILSLYQLHRVLSTLRPARCYQHACRRTVASYDTYRW